MNPNHMQNFPQSIHFSVHSTLVAFKANRSNCYLPEKRRVICIFSYARIHQQEGKNCRNTTQQNSTAKKVKNSQRIRSIVVKYLINTEKKKKLEILMDLNVKRVQMQLCAIKICHSLHLHLVPDTTIQKKCIVLNGHNFLFCHSDIRKYNKQGFLIGNFLLVDGKAQLIFEIFISVESKNNNCKSCN